jgi:hypothetical protein
MYKTEIYGRSLSEIGHTLDVMDAHNIKDAKALDRALSAPKAKAPEVRVEVVDALNLNRTLGYLTKRPVNEVRGHVVRVAMMAPIMALVSRDYIDSPITDTIKTIHFEFDRKTYESGWRVETVLKTHAKLEDLQNIDCFLLPGEDENEARFRRDHRAYRRR